MTQPDKTDPYAAREARKYDRPIQSREFILAHLKERGSPLSLDQVASELGLAEEVDLEALRRRLNAMERDGQLVRNRRGRYGIASKMNLVSGRVIGHPDGFGFLVPDDGSDDLFLTARQMRPVFHGDRILARVVGADRRGRREGALVEVLERNTHEVVGRYYIEGGIGLVVSSNKRIAHEVLIPPEHAQGATEGQIVVATITEQPRRHAQPIGRVVEILGDRMAPGMEITIATRSHQLPDTWPEEVEQQAEALGDGRASPPEEARRDLRDLPLVTIDGEDAQDFDDAVYCERDGRGWRLVVAIADVSAYVRPGDAVDQEARQRGNSVYFPGHVIPMLPQVLSNHLCSLRPDVERLSLVCDMQIGSTGRLREWTFYPARIRSHARLTYTDVAAALVERDAGAAERLAPVLPHLEALYQLFQVLRRARDRRGSIDFDSTETRLIFGEDRKIDRIVPVERNDAHRLIEECMITANVAAASFLLEHRMPALFRTHPGPDPDRLDDLRSFLAGFGLHLGGGERPAPTDYAEVIAAVAERPDRRLIETVLLRSLAQAVYGAENTGHFGLALDAYAHFTSPIRRYPDLLVHRAIRHALRGGRAEDFRYGRAEVQTIGDHCSMTERRADDATRDALDWLKCEYMLDKLGAEFDGTITGVTSFGLFVEIDGIQVQGLVPVSTIGDDYYRFDPIRQVLYGERTGVQFRLADRTRVKVVRVDLDERVIDFVLAEPPKAEAPAAAEKPRARSRRSRRGRRARHS